MLAVLAIKGMYHEIHVDQDLRIMYILFLEDMSGGHLDLGRVMLGLVEAGRHFRLTCYLVVPMQKGKVSGTQTREESESESGVLYIVPWYISDSILNSVGV